jgi:hypothetical protein
MDPIAPKRSRGAVIGIIVVVIVIVAAALYFWGPKMSADNAASTSDDASSIEADLQSVAVPSTDFSE